MRNRIRNLALMTEHIQSDVRHGVLMFAVDFVNPAYASHPLFEEAVKRYHPFKGDLVVEVIKKTKKVLEIVAILGGQWPHSSFMVPGGIASHPGSNDIFQCSYLLEIYKKWYEDAVLGCTLERWREVRNLADLEAWLEESYAHRNSHLGFYIRFTRKIGLDKIGKGYGNFLSYGSLDIPEGSAVKGKNNQPFLVPAGVSSGTGSGRIRSGKDRRARGRIPGIRTTTAGNTLLQAKQSRSPRWRATQSTPGLKRRGMTARLSRRDRWRNWLFQATR